MRFLVDEGISPLACDLLRRHGHEGLHVRAVGLGGKSDVVLAAYAREQHLAIMSLDFDFADIRHYPPEQHHGIIVFELPPAASLATTLRLIDVLVSDQNVLRHVAGRLVVVAFGRVRVRPPPT